MAMPAREIREWLDHGEEGRDFGQTHFHTHAVEEGGVKGRTRGKTVAAPFA
jgi:hypothetical protein